VKYNATIDDYEPEGPWDEPPRCPVCGEDMERDLCEHCDGSGEVDCYEDDAINYAPDQEYERCGRCNGEGGWWLCPQHGDDRHSEPANESAHQCRLCGHDFANGEDYDGHVTRRGETRYTCRDTAACLERRTQAAVSEPPPEPWPWMVTITLREGWEMISTIDAAGEADAINQAEAVARELLRVDVARDQISAVDVPF